MIHPLRVGGLHEIQEMKKALVTVLLLFLSSAPSTIAPLLCASLPLSQPILD